MKIEAIPASPASAAPAIDHQARARIDIVTRTLLDLIGTLESRIIALEQGQTELDDALREVEVPHG